MKKVNEKTIEHLRELHDKCKENPFWKMLSIDFHYEAVNELIELANNVFSTIPYKEFNTSPHLVLINAAMHNINDSILKAKLCSKYHKEIGDITKTTGFGVYIMCLQAYLQVMHNFIDDVWDDSIVIYEPLLYLNDDDTDYVCEFRTYTARQNEDGTYRLVRIIKQSEVEGIIKMHGELVESCVHDAEYCFKTNSPITADRFKKKAEYHLECMQSLSDNDEKHYIIKG